MCVNCLGVSVCHEGSVFNKNMTARRSHKHLHSTNLNLVLAKINLLNLNLVANIVIFLYDNVF